MAEYGFYEEVKGVLQAISEETGIAWDKLYDIVEAKLEPLYERIRAEYTQTEEYKVSQQHSAITRKYAAEKAQFEKIYGSNTYDRCYDVFGTLRNEEYLEVLKKYGSYYEQFKSNYNSYSYQNYSKGNYNGSYQGNNYSKHMDEEELIRLRKIYKKLSIKLHPDNGGSEEHMKMLNELKDALGL